MTLLAEHQRLRNAVTDAPKGLKRQRQAELAAWVRAQLERETARRPEQLSMFTEHRRAA